MITINILPHPFLFDPSASGLNGSPSIQQPYLLLVQSFKAKNKYKPLLDRLFVNNLITLQSYSSIFATIKLATRKSENPCGFISKVWRQRGSVVRVRDLNTEDPGSNPRLRLLNELVVGDPRGKFTTLCK